MPKCMVRDDLRSIGHALTPLFLLLVVELLAGIRVSGSELILVVVDDGRGFDPEKTRSVGHGLRGMRERVVALGGTST